MIIPSEPRILLSYVNTMLRDYYESLDEFCAAQNVSREIIEQKLEAIGYIYDPESNQFG